MRQRWVWDLPIRLFHWSLVLLFGFSWWSARTHHMDWHRVSGISILGLVIFRLLWGVFGTETARFAQFVKGPATIWRYLRGGARTAPAPPGHNPLGGWAVMGLLLSLGAQIAFGLFAVDVDGIESGPLSYLVDFSLGRSAARLHATGFNLLLGLILLHIAAIAFYLLVRRKNLIWPMLTGRETIPAARAGTVAKTVSPWRLAAALAVSVLLASGMAGGFRW